MTRLGNLLDIGKLLNPLATINLPKSYTFLDYFCKGVKFYHFSSEIILDNFYRLLAIFSGLTESGHRQTGFKTRFRFRLDRNHRHLSNYTTDWL